MTKLLIAILGLLITSNIKQTELCTSNALFPDGGAMAVAIMKGSFNGTAVNGTITFFQAVIYSFHEICSEYLPYF